MNVKKKSAVAWSFGKSNRSHYDIHKNPGPGAYTSCDVSFYKSKQPQWKLGRAKRSDSHANLNPGPGMYDSQTMFIHKEAPKYTMRPKTGTSLDIRNKDLPGPGNYNPDPKKNKDYKYSMRIRPQSASDLMNNPGPGAYNLRKIDSDLLKNNAIKFGNEKKHKDPDFTYLKNPGPGQYAFDKTPIIHKNPKFSFGKEDRSGDKLRPKTPGPGQYESKTIIGKDGPQISMSFYRPISAISSKTPGPGKYQPNLSHKNKSPEYKFGRSVREIVDKETRQKPGPGAYDSEKVNYVKNKAPQWKFGEDERGSNNKSLMNNPGPGNYEIKSSVGVAPKVRDIFNFSIL